MRFSTDITLSLELDPGLGELDPDSPAGGSGPGYSRPFDAPQNSVLADRLVFESYQPALPDPQPPFRLREPEFFFIGHPIVSPSSTLKERVQAFQAEAQKRYGVQIRLQSFERRADRQQMMHIAHMFCFNSFQNRRPRHSEVNTSGRHVIEWKYFTRPDLVWEGGVRWEDFLRTAHGRACVKEGKGWKAGFEPDYGATWERAYAVLETNGVSPTKKGGRWRDAMVAPGVDGCAPPCGCGGKASKHITGQAMDMNKRDLGVLERALKAHCIELDDYLRRFGLHRPMRHHKSSPEPWHVEALKL